ncbi:hypothetical protein ABK905_07430 [Acerihabitans sp. KWT182]|uniref:Uncharacterized protein n=1 Tax=Acerihabitans sp. KWT182 TaxID=3157919 RepID=A0AAU7QFD4_9GAMM
MTHIVQRLLGLPIQHFKLVPLAQWAENAIWVVKLLGSSMNIFLVDNQSAHIGSVILWALVFMHSFSVCFNKSKEAKFIATFSILTIAAIISSFVISFPSPDVLSARFFMNVVCFTIAMAILSCNYNKNPLIILILVLFVTSSLYSYHKNKNPLTDQEGQALSYINFLKKNDLTFGYGDYWKLSNIVNWFSNGSIHITPVLFDKKNYRIQFDEVRSQTMKSWMTEEYAAKAPERQFIAIPAIGNSAQDSQMNRRLEAIIKQVGVPDEKLTFQDMTLFVYNQKIDLH